MTGLSLSSSQAQAAVINTFTVTVTGTGCANAQARVVAMVFGSQGPDPTQTQVVSANAGGVATFGGVLTSTANYQFFALNNSCTPSMRDQAQDPNNPPSPITEGGNKTIALTQDTTQANIQINLTLPGSGSFPKLVSGGCQNGISNEQIGFGVAVATAANGASLIVYDIPPAAAGAYNCGVFDPVDNRGGGTLVSVATSSGVTTSVSVDLTKSFAPPPGAQTQANRSGQNGGVSNLSVVVTKASDGSAVTGAQMQLKTSSTTGGPFNFTQTDQNGVANFYFSAGQVSNGATVYMDVIPQGGLQGLTNQPFVSSDWTNLPVSTSVALSTAPAGTISGNVLIGIAPVPEVWVNCHQDFSLYPGNDAGNRPGAGFGGVNASTGYFSVANLAPGNYQCQVNSPFSNQPTTINYGADGQAEIPGSNTPPNDDLRLNISTSGAFQVFTSSDGTRLSQGQPLNVQIAVSTANATGTIAGTLVFPTSVNLAASPVVILAHGQFSNSGSTTPPPSGFSSVSGTGASQPFVMNVPAGTNYYMQILGGSYGPLENGNNNADLTTVSSVTLPNITMVPAGTIHVTVNGPKGTRFLPNLQPQGGNFQQFCGGNINAQGQNIQAFGGGQLSDQGDATISGLPAGVYNLQFGTYGQGCTVAGATLSGVSVTANQTTNATINLKNGIPLEVAIPSSLPPGTKIPGTNPPPNQIASVVGFEQGTPLTLDTLRSLTGKGGPTNAAPISLFENQTSTGPGAPLITVWQPLTGGFGTDPLVPPDNYTLRMFAQGFPRFEQAGANPGDFFFTLLGSTNVIVDAAHETTVSPIYGSSVVAVSIPASFGNATLTGLMTGTQFFTKDDFRAMGGDFNHFMNYMPVCAVYDSAGNILGYAMGIPPKVTTAVQNIETDVATQNTAQFLTDIKAAGSAGLHYSIPFLAAGTYQEVCTSPNYPPVVQQVVLTAGSTTTVNISFDTQAGFGGSLSGVVTDTGSAKLSGVTVVIKNRTATKQTTTDTNGAYSFIGLPNGIYRIYVSLPGYAQATDKKTIASAASVTENFTLTAAPGSITGTVVAQTFPNRQVAGGVQVVAYDDTKNADPNIGGKGVQPPYWQTVTGDDGTYLLNSPLPGDTIKIFAIADGKVVVGTSTVATSGQVTALDIIQLSLPPVPTVQVLPTGNGTVNITISVPKVLSAAPTLKCILGAVYTDTGATDESSLMVSAPGNIYVANNVPLPSATANNVCRVTANDGIKQQTVDTIINLTTLKKRSNNAIDRAAILGQSVSADASNLAAGGVDFYTGSIVLQTGSVPTTQIVQTDTGTAGVASSTNSFVSDAYQITLDSSVQTGSGFSISLALKRGSTVDPNAVQVAQIKNGVPVPISGTPFCDPLTGLCTIDVSNLTTAASAPQYRGAESGAPLYKGMAPSVGGKYYAYSTAYAASQAGSFVLITNSVQGAAYPGSSLNAYNFPNPFDLNPKTLTLKDPGSGAGSLTTNGTILRYDLPAANAGHVIIRIFTVTGELVQVLDQGTVSGGTTNYVTWDGKNMKGSQVASGIYFAVFDVPGLTPKGHVVKMAVLK